MQKNFFKEINKRVEPQKASTVNDIYKSGKKEQREEWMKKLAYTEN